MVLLKLHRLFKKVKTKILNTLQPLRKNLVLSASSKSFLTRTTAEQKVKLITKDLETLMIEDTGQALDSPKRSNSVGLPSFIV